MRSYRMIWAESRCRKKRSKRSGKEPEVEISDRATGSNKAPLAPSSPAALWRRPSLQRSWVIARQQRKRKSIKHVIVLKIISKGKEWNLNKNIFTTPPSPIHVDIEKGWKLYYKWKKINFIAFDWWDNKSTFLRISLLPHNPAKLDFMIIKSRSRFYYHVIVIHMWLIM